MDKNHYRFTNGSWETYNMAMEEHGLQGNYESTSQDHSPWPYYLHNDAATSSPGHLLRTPTPQATNFKDDDGDREAEDFGEELGAMKEMMFKIAAMQPVDIDPATIRKPRRRNVRISDDPQSMAARHRRERISEKIRILQRLVPGGTKMDTASMLDEAIRYVKFLKREIRVLQGNGGCSAPSTAAVATTSSSYLFEGNNGADGAAGDDLPVCLSNKFIGD